MDDLRAVFECNDDAEKDDYLIRINENDAGFEFLKAALLIINQLGMDFHCYRQSDNISVYLDGQYMDNIAIGAAIPPVKLSFHLDPDVASPPQSEAETEQEEMDSTSHGDEDNIQDTSSYSLLSNSGQRPINYEVNELLAGRAQYRLQQRLDQFKREAEESSTVTYDPSIKESLETATNQDVTPTITDIGQQSSVCVDDVMQPPVQETRASRRLRMPTQRYGDPIPTDVKNLFLCTSERNELFEVSEVTEEDKNINPEMFDNTCNTELQGWYDLADVEEVNIDQMVESKCHPLLTRWVHVWKKEQYGTKSMKSRLGIKGFQEDQSQLRTYSPTVAREILILRLTIFYSKTWSVKTINVKQAFLQSDELQRPVNVIPPAEAFLSPDTI